jgi:hypothetical protein
VSTPSKGSLKKEVILLIDNNWEMNIGMGLISATAQKMQAFKCSSKAYFAFKLTDLEGNKGKAGRDTIGR